MNNLNKWLEHWEPMWLFLVLSLEVVFSYAGAILIAKRLATKKPTRKKKEDSTFEYLTMGEGK